MQRISISSKKRCELIDITAELAAVTKNTTGIMTVYCPHTTAGIIINEGADPDVQADALHALAALVPENRSYKHAEGNADAHIKSILTGGAKMVPIENGVMQIGQWQKVFFAEFDGPRKRNVYVQLLQGETHDV